MRFFAMILIFYLVYFLVLETLTKKKKALVQL